LDGAKTDKAFMSWLSSQTWESEEAIGHAVVAYMDGWNAASNEEWEKEVQRMRKDKAWSNPKLLKGKTAAETKKTLRSKLIRKAFQNPDQRSTLLPVIAKLAGDKMPKDLLDKFKGKEDEKDGKKASATKVAVKAPAGFEVENIKIGSKTAYLLKKGDTQIGFVKPGSKTKTDTFPSQVFKGIGAKAKMIAAFFPKSEKGKLDDADTGHATMYGSVDDALAYLAKGGKTASATKVAVKPETEDFVRWALSTQSPMHPKEVEAVVSRTLGIKTEDPKPKRGGARFWKGDAVKIDVSKHKSPKFDKAMYEKFNGKLGTITDAEAVDVLIAFKGEPAPVRFPGAQSARGVGIYKYTAPYTVQGSSKVEIIYNAGGKPTPDALIVVDAYRAGGGKTEKRAANYYTGYVVQASVGAKGYYFRAFPQQRVDPNSEGGYIPRTFNPSLGDLFYIGIFGKRPTRWEAELKKLEEAAN